MRTFTRIFNITIALLFLVTLTNNVDAQTGILNPNDPIVVYNPAAPPATPAYGTLAKWVKTNRVGFTTTSFKAYFYKGVAFRVKFPKTYQHNVADGKSYPLYLFYHGIGEKGSIYDNEYQLYHGGQTHMNAVDNGKFDGFLVYPQTSAGSGYFGESHYATVKEFIEKYMIPEVKVDPNRIIVDGLSGGGSSTWAMTYTYPTFVAGALPISAVAISHQDEVQKLKWTPIWLFQGGLDTKPSPFTAQSVINVYRNAGANISYTEYPNIGHGCWNAAWSEANYFPYLNKIHKANPWPLFGRTEFCPGDAISATMGVTAGFSGYEWRRNGVLIPGATGNTYTATQVGVYDCRILRGTVWSPWSPIPVEIKIKGATQPPTINISGLASKVIPSPDGKNSINLEVPAGYSTYSWVREGSAAVLSSTRSLTVSSAGNYKVQVLEQFGCSSEFSTPFSVIDANGANGPSAATSLLAAALSKTEIRISWNQNPAPVYNETAFEIYRSTDAGGPYVYLGTAPSNATNFISAELNPNTTYYYKVRAINDNGASATSEPVSAKTQQDNNAPSAPGNLRSGTSSRNSVELYWDESTDDVGIQKYEIFVNGVKFYETDLPNFTVYNLIYGQQYAFKVRAIDLAGNFSPMSNQVSAQPLNTGLSYKYYTYTQNLTVLPDFNTWVPVSTGTVPNVTINNRTQNDRFAYLWEGFITAPVTGTYTFRTTSDDGSKLYIGNYSHTATALVNNDGLHGNVTQSGTIYLTAGVAYPIAMTFFEMTGGEGMSVSWIVPGTSTAVAIPNSAFADQTQVYGVSPAIPSQLQANAVDFRRINLSWTDNSSNESGFEIWRSDNAYNNFQVIGSTNADITNYTDSIGLLPSTTYYYKIRSVGQYGESQFTPVYDAQANWKFDNNLKDATANNAGLTPSGTINYDGDAEKEGTHALQFNGSNTHLDINNVADDYLRGAYTQKTISFWMRSANNTGNRILVDIGGSDNGLSLRLDANRLYAGVASNNTRRNFFVNYTSTSWDHIALVYNTNSLKLYVNGVLSGSNLNLGFTTVNATSNASRIGTVNSSNAFATGSGRFSGAMDNLAIFGRALSDAEILQLANQTYMAVGATTQALPPAPAAPSALVANGVTPNAIELNWVDNATDELKYEVYRSTLDNNDFNLIATLPENTVTYTDGDLFPNSGFKYKVKAVNIGGSVESNEVTASTANNAPVLSAIPDQFVRFGSQLILNIQATDSDPGLLTLEVSNLPAFALYAPTGNGTGTITFSPAITDIGSYNGINILVRDQQGEEGTLSFNLVVYNNYSPVITGISNATINESQTTQLNLTATDQDVSDVLTWTFAGLPSFATVTSTNGNAQINIAPGYADNGVYAVLATIDDGQNGTDTSTFYITVNDVNPNKTVYVNFTSGTYIAAAPWNNTNKIPANNDLFSNLKDANGSGSGINVQLLTGWVNANNAGSNTGNNSGVYPDAVLRSNYYTSTTSNFRVTGLAPGNKYSFTFLGSRANPTVGVVSTYSSSGQTVTLNAANNSQNTVSLNKLQPAADGTISFSVGRGAGSGFAYLSSLVIKTLYNDGTVPAKAKNLTGVYQSNGIVLNWADVAYNEEFYEVHRSLSQAGPFVQINQTSETGDLSQYLDINVLGGSTYYYKIRSRNDIGVSEFSDVVAVSTPNLAPVITPISNVTLDAADVVNVQVTALDPGDIITLSASSLPSFVSFTDNGNGSGTFVINPASTYVGPFNGITVTATDAQNSSSSVQFNITVTSSTLAPPPTNLSATALNRSTIQLKWNAPTGVTVSGYEVWGSAASDGVYTKIVDLGGSILSYNHSNLTASTAYYYKVKAIVNSNPTNFSNYAGAYTVAYLLNVNMNDGSVNAPAQQGNWNNINALVSEGFTLSNMINDEGLNTGIDLSIARNFSGFNIYGAVTGNNSGIYPDNVIKSFYYMNYADTAQIIIRDLNLAHTYSFVFFGSRVSPQVGVTTAYKIGNKVVTLNAANNSSARVQIDGIKPNSDGTVLITMYGTISGGFGYLNALTIYGAPSVAQDPSLLSSALLLDVNDGPVSEFTRIEQAESVILKQRAYPNPFSSELNVQLELNKNVSKLALVLTDMSGRVIMRKEYSNVQRGIWQQRLDINGQTLKSGMYILQIHGADNNKISNMKLIKR